MSRIDVAGKLTCFAHRCEHLFVGWVIDFEVPHQGERARAGGRVLASGDEKACELRGGDLIVGSEPERRIEGTDRRLAIAER